MAMVALSFTIEGRVQGVGFRYWTVRLARSLFITGVVGNRSDGTVFIQAQGKEPDMVRFKESLFEGPPGAVVRKVTEMPLSIDPGITDFSII